MTLEPGRVVGGKYRVERLLGRGGMGAVYEATQLGLMRRVALKVLHHGAKLDARARARLEREARVSASFEHDAAVAVHDFGEEGDLVYLAMELLEGEPLRATIARDAPMTWARASAIAATIADVLEAAHRAGVVHRDLKPENVFVEPSGRTRLVDFGLAFIAHGAKETARLTVEGVVAGTPEYISPEQARGAELDGATDVYALGCVLYEMLAGSPPFVGGEIDVLTRHMFAPPPPLRDRVDDPSRPAALDALLAAMLDKRRDARPDAREVLRAIEGLGAAERARTAPLAGREARMVAPVGAKGSGVDAEIEVAVLGTLPPDVVLGLAANGIATYALEGQAGSEVAIAIDVDDAALEALAKRACVVAIDDARDVARLTRLMALGVSEVASRPIAIDDLTRRVRRALTLARRRGPR